jgi:hypothetical protein
LVALPIRADGKLDEEVPQGFNSPPGGKHLKTIVHNLDAIANLGPRDLYFWVAVLLFPWSLLALCLLDWMKIPNPSWR